jgi:KDO2-lipid IV(A) lauroyltransferase
VKQAPLRHWLEYAGFLPLATALSFLGVGQARALGRLIGVLVALLPTAWKRVARSNLQRAFPEKCPEEQRQILQGAFRHIGGAFFEIFPLARLSASDLCERISWEGYEHLLAAERAGRGVIVLSAHFGCWEVVPLALGATSRPLASVGRPLDNPWVDRWLQRLRTRFGNRSLPKRGAIREMFRTLERGERLGLLLDQRVRPSEGIEVPFFGHPAWTSSLVARLALRTGAAVVGVASYPEPRGRFRIRFEPPLTACGPDNPKSTLEFTQTLLEQDERTIRGQPELWFWFHDRWKR